MRSKGWWSLPFWSLEAAGEGWWTHPDLFVGSWGGGVDLPRPVFGSWGGWWTLPPLCECSWGGGVVDFPPSVNGCSDCEWLYWQSCGGGWYTPPSPSWRRTQVSKLSLFVLLANPLRQAPRQSSSPSVSPLRVAECLANPLRQLQNAVGTAGPHPPRSDRNEHRSTSPSIVSTARIPTGNFPSSVCTATPQPPGPSAVSIAGISTGVFPSSVSTAIPQPPTSRAQ